MAKTKGFLKKNYSFGLATGFLLALLFFVLIPQVLIRGQQFLERKKLEKIEAAKPKPLTAEEKNKLTSEVLPKDGVNLGIKFGDAVVKVMEVGALDKEKLTALYKGRGGLPADQEKLLASSSNDELKINKENANFLLNLLWPLGLANKTAVLSEGPMGTTYKDKIDNFASTGGWTLGREPGGKLFNRFTIINLTTEQEKIVRELAENIYRPCCGNSTFFPDCNHGTAMLGFLELAVSQGMSKEEVYKKALVLNSFWFPETYLDLGTYFKAKEKKKWTDIEPKLLLGQLYSSGQGYQAVRKEMETLGILPKPQGGASCGV